MTDRLAEALEIIREAEAILGRLSPGRRRDLLMDNRNWSTDEIVAIVDHITSPPSPAECEPPLTLRKLCALVGDEFMDSPLFAGVRGSGNYEIAQMPLSLWQMPRIAPRPDTKEPGRLVLDVYLEQHRMLKKKDGAR